MSLPTHRALPPLPEWSSCKCSLAQAELLIWFSSAVLKQCLCSFCTAGAGWIEEHLVHCTRAGWEACSWWVWPLLSVALIWGDSCVPPSELVCSFFFYLKGLVCIKLKRQNGTGELISHSAGFLQQAEGDKARKENSEKLTLTLATAPCLFFKPLNRGNLISSKKAE